MKVSFRQGIIRHPVSNGLQDFLRVNGSYVDLVADNGDIDINFAHILANYYYTESNTVSQAWGPFTASTDQWLYWDIDLLTGARTFGITLLEPITSDSEPTSPADDQHWFDSVSTTMFVYSSGAWNARVRVFSAMFNGVNVFTSMSGGLLQYPFAGSQVSLGTETNFSGRIVFDGTGAVVTKTSTELFTTEDQFFAEGSDISAVRLESNVHQATTYETIGAYNIVKYMSDGRIQLAAYNDIGDTVVGVVPEATLQGNIGTVIVQGSIKNISWTWTTVNAPLWINDSGELTETDLSISDPSGHPVKHVPVGRVISSNEIIFEQGLGGIGRQGPQGDAGLDGGSAWGTIAGTLSDQTDLQTELNAKADNSHTQAATTVTVTAAGNISSANVQAALEELDTEKLAVTGGTLTGSLILDGDPSVALGAATKQYVDNSTSPPAGANTQLQYNSSGAFGASANLTYDGTAIDLDGRIELSSATSGTPNVRFEQTGETADEGNWEIKVTDNEFSIHAANDAYDSISEMIKAERGTGELVSVLNIGSTEVDQLELSAATVVNVNTPLVSLASDTASAGFNIPEGVAPTSPVDGDMWVTIDDIFAQINGTSESLLGGGGGVPAGGTVGQFLIKQSATDGDAIWDDLGASVAGSEYCPGYGYTFINVGSFSVPGVDVTNLIATGRNLKFIEGTTFTYGEVVSSSFGGGVTTVIMDMNGAEELTAGVTEFCMVTGATTWSPAAADPFSGNAIQDIVSGSVGGTIYWVIVGNGGRIAYSTDGGLTWTTSSSGTVENLYQVDFNPNAETFVAVGNGEVITRSTDGINWTADTVQVNTIKTDGDGDVLGVIYHPKLGVDEWMIAFQSAAVGTIAMAYSTDDGVTWTVFETSLVTNATSIRDSGLNVFRTTANVLQGVMYASSADDVYYVTDRTDISDQVLINNSGRAKVTALISRDWTLGGGLAHFQGFADGEIARSTSNFETTPNTTFGTSAIRAFAWSNTHNRVVAVGDDGKIATIEESNMGSGEGPFSLVANGSNPLSNFTEVHWDETDGLFIAVNDAGQILRSTNGLGTGASFEYSGWTAIAADPFSGGNIDFIVTGTIGITEWWMIAGSTQLYTSTDAGITWTVRTTNLTTSITALSYDSTNEVFVAGTSDGDFSWTSNGTAWTLDNTSVTAIKAAGSGRINSMVWDIAGGLWQFIVDHNATSVGTYSCTGTFTGFAIHEGSTTANMGYRNTGVYQTGIASRSIWSGGTTIGQYWSGATDTGPSAHASMVETITAVFGKPGTLGDAADIFYGDNNGDIELWATAKRTGWQGALVGSVNGIAWSSVSDRMIAVGNAGEIKTIAGAAIESGGWFNVVTPFSGNINAVAYSASDDIFICVCADGVIARSTDGISYLAGSPA